MTHNLKHVVSAGCFSFLEASRFNLSKVSDTTCPLKNESPFLHGIRKEKTITKKSLGN